MYQAEQRGRGRWKLAPTGEEDGRRTELGMERALRRALAAEKLAIAYQPIISLTEGGVRTVEALLRWRAPDIGPISPEVFIPVAESSDLILAVGEYVIKRACRQMA